MNWKIKTFDDYHDIENYSKNLKAIELGCYPQKGYEYFRYFGLFYSGRKPTTKQIFPALKRKLQFRSSVKNINQYSLQSIGLSEEDVMFELKKILKK